MTTTTTVTVEPQKMTPRHWAVAVGGVLSMISASVFLSGLSLMHPFIVKEMFTDAQGRPIHGGQPGFFVYYTVLTIAIVVTMMLASGPLITKFGPRLILGVGSSIMGLGVFIFALAPNTLVFYVAGAIIGAGYGLALAPVPPVVTTSWFEAKRGLVLGIVLAGSGIGGLMWSIGTPIMGNALGWRVTIMLMAALLVALAVFSAVFLIRNTPADVGLLPYGSLPGSDEDESHDPDTLPGFVVKDALRSPWFWLLAFALVLIGVIVAMTQVLAILLVIFTGSNTSAFSTLLAAWTFTLLFWKPLLGMISDKLGVIWMMIISMGLMSLGFLYLTRMSTAATDFGIGTMLLPMLAMVFMASGISNATVSPPLVVRQTVGARDYSKLLSIGLAFYYAGQAIGAPLWGGIQTLTGNYNLGFYAAPVVLALIIVCCFFATRHGSSRWTNPPLDDVAAPTSR